MDSDSWTLFITLLGLILVGGYFSAAEMSFASVGIIKMKSRAENGDKRAKNAVYIMENFEKALSTLLIGNNILQICVASLGTLFVTRIWGEGYLAYSTIVITIIVFMISEMLPKKLASDKPEQVALALAASLRFLMKILTPISVVFNKISSVFTNLLGGRNVPTVTEDELYDIIESITEDGVMEQERGRLLHSALEFDDTTAEEVITARVSIVGIEENMTCNEILAVIKNNKFSRLPVYRETLDDIVGVLNIKQYMKIYLKIGEKISIKNMMQSPYFAPRRRSIDDLFKDMTAKKVHMSVITDDYGGTLGIVTMEDILEELVGEIWDEDDVVREDFKPIGGNRYEVSGDMNILDAFEMMGYNSIANDMESQTVGAWVQENIDEIPKKGSRFSFEDLTAIILQIDNQQHITKIMLKLNIKGVEKTEE